MSNNPFFNKKTRNVDAESGINRVSSRKKKAPLPPPSDSEPEYVDPELEQEQEMPAKDDSVRKKKKSSGKKPARVANHGVEGEEESGSELADAKKKEIGSTVAPHMMMLLAATYHIGFASITRPAISTWIPSCYSLFTMAYTMMELVSENTYLMEMCPSFFSPAFYCYVGYLYFYQILRAKDEVGQGQLSRAERRVLRQLKNIGEPEAWPVPAPLIEFIRALGYYKSDNPVFSYVVPQLPAFDNVSRPAGNTTNLGYMNFENVPNLHRVPPIAAYVEFLRLFGARTSAYEAAQGWIPADNATLSATNTFMGLTDSRAVGVSFQSFVFSDGWNAPTEGEMRWGPIQAATKRQTIRRWNLPTTSNINIDSIETFTSLQDTVNTTWIRQLISMANIVSRFFPGSTTLAAIDPVSHLGNLTNVYVTKTTARNPRTDQWYRGRTGWTFKYRGYDDTEQGRILARIGLATMTNAHFTANVVPVGNRGAFRTGPFFIDDATNPLTERAETFRMEGETESDPAGRFSEQVSSLFDPTGGRK